MAFEVNDRWVGRVGKVKDRECPDVHGCMRASIPWHHSDVYLPKPIQVAQSIDLFGHYVFATDATSEDSGAEDCSHLKRRLAIGDYLLSFMAQFDLTLNGHFVARLTAGLIHRTDIAGCLE